MEEILKHPFVLLIAAFLFGSGGAGLTLLGYWLYRRKHKAEADKIQGEADKIIRENAEANRKSWEEQLMKFNTVFIENETNKHLLKVKTDSYTELFKMVEEILIKQGRQEKSEEFCQQQMKELKLSIEEKDKQISALQESNKKLEERISSMENSKTV